MEENRSQTVRFGDETMQIQTVIIRGVECFRLKDIQRQFPSVTALCIDNVQLAFVVDECGNDLEPLHVEACKHRVIEARAPRRFSDTDFDDHFNRIHANMDKLQMTTARIDTNTQEILNQMRYVMTQMYELQEFTTPRYFFILPAKRYDWEALNTVQDWFQVHYKLYFFCECSDEPEKLHVAPHDGYTIKKPREFIARYGSYLRNTLRIAQLLLLPGLFKQSNNSDHMKKRVLFIEKLLEKIEKHLTRTSSSLLQQAKSQGSSLQGADLRELESYLEFVDYKHSFGNLYRIVTTDGHVRWVCMEHYDAISFNNKMSEYISQLEAIGGQFNQENKVAVITKVNLTSKNIKMLSEALRKGFNIIELVFQNCSIDESDLDTLLDVIINRSSICCLKMNTLDVRNLIGMSKYICQYMIIHFNNQSFKVRFNDHYRDGNIQIFLRILLQNKIYRTLDFSACDFFGCEEDLRRCLDTNGMLTGLIVQYSNNIDILNAISNFKINTLHQLKLNYSLRLPSTLSRFCEILKINETLVEIDIMDSIGFNDLNFIIDLFSTLREHKSIKYLSLHICNVKPFKQKEVSLMDSLINDKFISRLCLSKSIISPQLTQTLVYASQERRSLTYLEFYGTRIGDQDLSQLKSLYNNETLIHLTFSEQPTWPFTLEETTDSFKKGKCSGKKSNIISGYDEDVITRK
jgi:hypothetical protein